MSYVVVHLVIFMVLIFDKRGHRSFYLFSLTETRLLLFLNIFEFRYYNAVDVTKMLDLSSSLESNCSLSRNRTDSYLLIYIIIIIIYYYLFTAIGFAPGGSGPYTTQLQLLFCDFFLVLFEMMTDTVSFVNLLFNLGVSVEKVSFI
jgi:hypothetical protein